MISVGVKDPISAGVNVSNGLSGMVVPGVDVGFGVVGDGDGEGDGEGEGEGDGEGLGVAELATSVLSPGSRTFPRVGSLS